MTDQKQTVHAYELVVKNDKDPGLEEQEGHAGFIQGVHKDNYLQAYSTTLLVPRQELAIVGSISSRLNREGILYAPGVEAAALEEFRQKGLLTEFDEDEIQQTSGSHDLLTISRPGLIHDNLSQYDPSQAGRLQAIYGSGRVLLKDVGLGPINRAGIALYQVQGDGTITYRDILLSIGWKEYGTGAFQNEVVGRTVESFVASNQEGPEPKTRCLEFVEGKGNFTLSEIVWEEVKSFVFGTVTKTSSAD